MMKTYYADLTDEQRARKIGRYALPAPRRPFVPSPALAHLRVGHSTILPLDPLRPQLGAHVHMWAKRRGWVVRTQTTHVVTVWRVA